MNPKNLLKVKKTIKPVKSGMAVGYFYPIRKRLKTDIG
jgi:hypothetical protein